MASVRDYIRINPIDIDNRKAIGVRFPFNAEGVFFSTFTTAEQVKSNLLNILLTEPGERIFKPNFGVGLREYLFENFTDEESLRNRINSQINLYLPQIELLNVSVNRAPDSHELYVEISYRLKVNSEENTIQINFTSDSDLSTSTASSPSMGNVNSGTSTGPTGGGSSGGGGGY